MLPANALVEGLRREASRRRARRLRLIAIEIMTGAAGCWLIAVAAGWQLAVAVILIAWSTYAHAALRATRAEENDRKQGMQLVVKALQSLRETIGSAQKRL